MPNEVLESRLKEIQLDVKHMKAKLDAIAYFVQKIEKEGLKVRKWS